MCLSWMPFTNNMDRRSGPTIRWVWSSIHIVWYPASDFCWKLVVLRGITLILWLYNFYKFYKLSKNFWSALYFVGFTALGQQCPYGWYGYSPTSKCYRFVTASKLPWQDARDFCKLHGGDLLKIDSIQERVRTVHFI